MSGGLNNSENLQYKTMRMMVMVMLLLLMMMMKMCNDLMCT